MIQKQVQLNDIKWSYIKLILKITLMLLQCQRIIIPKGIIILFTCIFIQKSQTTKFNLNVSVDKVCNIYQCVSSGFSLQQFFMMSQRSLTVFQKILNVGFNVRYTIIGLFQSIDKQSMARPGYQICFLGQTIAINKLNLEQQNKLLYELFVTTPWLTYRTGFPELYNDIQGTYVSDTGWGCMIRVGQMAFAQMIKKHLKITTQDQMTPIIEMFSDFDRSRPFSIQNISKVARRQFGLLPGQWFNPSQIAHALSLLHQTSLENQQKLTFLIFNSGNMFFDQLVQAMLGGCSLFKCSCDLSRKKIVCEKCNNAKCSLAVVLLTRIGLQSPEDKYLRLLFKMMAIRQFQGMIGGKPKKALYFLGSYNDDAFIYLDPHYVQQASLNVKDIRDSYFCGSFRVCKGTAIDPSIGLCYYVQDLSELNNFYQALTALREANQSDFFLWVTEKTPNYMSKSKRLSKSEQVDEEYYETL